MRSDDVRAVAASVGDFRVVHTPDDFYVPGMRIAATGSPVTVVSVGFVIPGLPNLSCAPPEPVRIDAGAALDVFQSFGYSTDGARTTADTGKVLVLVRDDSGAASVITATGPVITGSSPSRETGSWFACN